MSNANGVIGVSPCDSSCHKMAGADRLCYAPFLLTYHRVDERKQHLHSNILMQPDLEVHLEYQGEGRSAVVRARSELGVSLLNELELIGPDH